MARSVDDILRQMKAQLAILDPDISTEPVTPEYKIMATVAEVIADAEVDKNVIDYQFDIDAKVGADLDKFVALFGFARQTGRRATGFVTFSRQAVADRDLIVPVGSQVVKPATSISPAVVFNVINTATLYTGTYSVEAAVECTVTGDVGNVPAGSIVSLGTSGGTEISSVYNENATTGGSAEETDEELRIRFKNTIFRNVSGTKDQLLALSIASRFAKKANVIGPISRFVEYLGIATNTPSGGNTGAISQIPYSKYTYPFDYYLTDGDTGNELFYSKLGVDYTFNTTAPPSITVVNATNLPVGKQVLLEHSYTSANSRNNPVTGLANYIDIFVSGQDISSTIEACIFPTSGSAINNTALSPYQYTNFKRYEDNSDPVIGNYFQELLWQPTIGLPSQITIGGASYTLGTDYFLLRDITVYKGSTRARNGIEWVASTATSIALNAPFQITYTFDGLPLTINELIDSHKQVTTDVLVHSATEVFFNINLLVMYSPGFAPAAVNSAISTALTNFLERQDFGAVIQISDIENVVHDVQGVDNVRLTVASDNGIAGYGIQEVASDGITPKGSPKTRDFALQDSDLPVLNNVVDHITQRSQNTWDPL